MSSYNLEDLNISRITYEIKGKRFEGLIMKPPGEGPFPGVVYIHGHASDAWTSIWFGYPLMRAGFAVFLPSMLGYGMIRGIPDFCGPKTVQGVLEGVRYFSEMKFVDSHHVGVWGISRGGAVAASCLVAAPDLFQAGVLQSGIYEMERNWLTTQIPGIKELIEKEAGTTPQAFRERSPLYDMDKLAAPVFIFHGDKDDRVSVEQARLLDAKLTELGKPHETVILPDIGHYTYSNETRIKYIFPYLEKYLKTETR